MDAPLVKAHLDHRRAWQDFLYAYPVISRRSQGVSLGINLNPDKKCSFNCVYCEVDRINAPRTTVLNVEQLTQEMAALLDLTLSGALFQHPPFDSATPTQRRLNDMAFSGDGEPTLCPHFTQAVAAMAQLKGERGLDTVKLVLITNGSGLQLPANQEGLRTLMDNQGEIWAKLDAGTTTHYQHIDRSGIPFERHLDNLLKTAQRWPITLQTLFLSWEGKGPSEEEVKAYMERVQAILQAGGQLQGIQLYTVARPTPEPAAKPLPATALNALADRLRHALPALPVMVFPGPC